MPPENIHEADLYYVIDRDDGEREYVKITKPLKLFDLTVSEEDRSKNKLLNEELLKGGDDDMLTFMAMLLVTLIGIALAIFGVIATIVGVTWLLWPIVVAAIVLIVIGYRAGKKKIEKKGEE